MGQECCKPEGQEDPENPKNVVRFFMVGTGGAGKTTVVRQLKCLCKESPKEYKAFNPGWQRIEHDDIFSPLEMEQFKRRIKWNIVTAVYNLIEQTHEWGSPISAAEGASRVKDAKEEADVKMANGARDVNLEDDLADDLIRLLDDESIKKTLNRSHQMSPEYRLEDGTLHFLNENQIRRIFDKETEATCDDIVHSRYPTTDIEDFRFGIKKMRMQIHDMGGQTSELIKLPEFIQQWVRTSEINCRNFVLFVTSMADFNLVDESNREFTAMDRAVRTLDIILGMGAVHECGVMIFFNKQDRFDHVCQELIKSEEGRKEIVRYLGSGLSKDKKEKVTKGIIEEKHLHDAVANKFIKVIKAKRKGEGSKGVYMKFTQATDREVMRAIFDAIDSEDVSSFVANIDIISI